MPGLISAEHPTASSEFSVVVAAVVAHDDDDDEDDVLIGEFLIDFHTRSGHFRRRFFAYLEDHRVHELRSQLIPG